MFRWCAAANSSADLTRRTPFSSSLSSSSYNFLDRPSPAIADRRPPSPGLLCVYLHVSAAAATSPSAVPGRRGATRGLYKRDARERASTPRRRAGRRGCRHARSSCRARSCRRPRSSEPGCRAQAPCTSRRSPRRTGPRGRARRTRRAHSRTRPSTRPCIARGGAWQCGGCECSTQMAARARSITRGVAREQREPCCDGGDGTQRRAPSRTHQLLRTIQ